MSKYEIINGRRRSKLCNFGIVDVDYSVTNPKGDKSGACPYYMVWRYMIDRCYGNNIKPWYEGCSVADQWSKLSEFIKWVNEQPNRDWQNCELDKDFLRGSKVYSPETCVFIPKIINTFSNCMRKRRGNYPLGVTYHKSAGRLVAACSDPFNKKSIHLGYFDDPIEAHLVWKAKKHEFACMLADTQVDERVAEILRNKYAPDTDWLNID